MLKAHSSSVFETSTIEAENRSPFLQNYGLASPKYSPLLTEKQSRFQSRFELANYLSHTRDGSNALYIDGETWIWTNSIQFPIYSDMMLSISLPWLKHSDGIADHSIYQFHDLFQLPQNGRDKVPDDQFTWRLEHNSQTVFHMDSGQSDLGDIRFSLSWTNPEATNQQINVHVDLPTGRFDSQSGNDKLDVGASWIKTNPDWLRERDWLVDTALSVWYGAGLSYVTHNKTMAQYKPNRWVVNARLGVAWQATRQWHLKAQLDTHSPLFNSDIRELGWMPLMASIGAEFEASKRVKLNITLLEDLRPRVTPDAVFTFGTSIVF